MVALGWSLWGTTSLNLSVTEALPDLSYTILFPQRHPFTCPPTHSKPQSRITHFLPLLQEQQLNHCIYQALDGVARVGWL